MSERARQTADRFGYQLAILVLAAFVAVVGLVLWLPQQTIGGAPGWLAGAALALAVAELGRRPCGTVAWRLVNGRSW